MKKRELLVIDDEESIHQILTQYLATLDITTHSAYDGNEGLSMLASHPSIHVVLTDIRIPGKDGLDVLRDIKLRYPAVQVILMTAFSDKNLAIQALRLGADDYLEKPFRLDDLRQRLDRSFNRIRLQTLSYRWQHFFEHLPLGALWCSSGGRVEKTTAGAEEILQVGTKEIIGQELWKLKGLDEAKVLFQQDGEKEQSIQINIGDRWLVLQKADTHEKVSHQNLIILTDITEQKDLQKELSQLTLEFEDRVQERTRSLTSEVAFTERLLDTASVMIAFIDQSGNLIRLNKFAEDLTGYSFHEAQQVISHIAADKRSPLSSILDIKYQYDVHDHIAEIKIRDGSTRILSWSTRFLSGRIGMSGKLIIGIDVTEQKQLEATLQNYNLHLKDLIERRSLELRQKNAQLIHTARLATLGEIAAGIAHEMKQPLNVISITSDLIKLLHKNGTITPELLYSNLEKIRNTVERMANTINHLRGFTHIDSTNFKMIKIEDAVDGALSIVGEQIRLDGIDLVKEIPRDLPTVQGEMNQIEQILVNFMQNARDALDEKRQKLAAEGKPDEHYAIKIIAGTSQDGKEVFVEVRDNGPGMSAEVKKRLFEPFFTTKESEHGTGLGLSICLNIAQSHGGDIQVESTLGKGSVMRVIFPSTMSLVEIKNSSENVNQMAE